MGIDANMVHKIQLVSAQSLNNSNALDKKSNDLAYTADYWNNRGLNFSFQQNYYDAIECYEKAIEINPKYAEAWYNKGNAFMNLRRIEKNINRYNDAIQCFDQAIQIDPHYANAWNIKGIALYGLGRYSEGEDATNKANQLYNK